MSILYFIHSIKDYQRFKDMSNNAIFICFNPIIMDYLRSKNEKCYFYDSFISKEEGVHARKYMYKLIESWYLDNGKDIPCLL